MQQPQHNKCQVRFSFIPLNLVSHHTFAFSFCEFLTAKHVKQDANSDNMKLTCTLWSRLSEAVKHYN